MLSGMWHVADVTHFWEMGESKRKESSSQMCHVGVPYDGGWSVQWNLTHVAALVDKAPNSLEGMGGKDSFVSDEEG